MEYNFFNNLWVNISRIRFRPFNWGSSSICEMLGQFLRLLRCILFKRSLISLYFRICLLRRQSERTRISFLFFLLLFWLFCILWACKRILQLLKSIFEESSHFASYFFSLFGERFFFLLIILLLPFPICFTLLLLLTIWVNVFWCLFLSIIRFLHCPLLLLLFSPRIGFNCLVHVKHLLILGILSFQLCLHLLCKHRIYQFSISTFLLLFLTPDAFLLLFCLHCFLS